MTADLQQQFVQDMSTESFEGLDRYDRAILALERNEADAETLHHIFRVVHTLKGTAGCLGFRHIQRVTHAGENLLDLLRSGDRPVTPPVVSALLRLSDALRALLQHLAAAGTDEAPLDTAPLVAELNLLGA